MNETDILNAMMQFIIMNRMIPCINSCILEIAYSKLIDKYYIIVFSKMSFKFSVIYLKESISPINN
jgi:hypothetical protein